MDKPISQWIQDSYGENTFHTNESNKSFQESLIGRLKGSGSIWRVFLKDGKEISPDEGCISLARARRLMEDYFEQKNKKFNLADSLRKNK